MQLDNNFKFTINNIIELLNTDGCNTKYVLKKRFENMTIIDLRDLKYSIEQEINIRKGKGEKG